jgi:hypothetical protein
MDLLIAGAYIAKCSPDKKVVHLYKPTSDTHYATHNTSLKKQILGKSLVC